VSDTTIVDRPSDTLVVRDPYFAPRASGASAPPPAIVLGAMNFGKRAPAKEAEAIVARAYERGVRLFDTANVYVDGESERILGRALKGKHDAMIATKVGLARAPDLGGKAEGLGPKRIWRGIEASLERLGRESIELYYLHAPDPMTPIEATLEALARPIERGQIRRWGVSNYASWQLVEIEHLCKEMRLLRPSVSQVLYNLLIRQLEIEYFGFTRKHPIHTTIYNPLAGGFLTGKHSRSGAIPKGSRFDGNSMYQRRYWSDGFFDVLERYRAVAEKEGLSLVELAYAWVAGREGVDSILVGPASVAHLDAALDAVAKPLSPEARRRIDGIHLAFVGTDARYAR
jgi:aryl-alcohol dehydrogenase-like predicted oxidoreductase